MECQNNLMQEMEKLASRKLRISAKETMKIAEKLYTQGFISYPRTETNGLTPRQGKKSDQAHPPIHPTKYAANLASENERKLYEFIVRHFLACVSKDAQVC